MSIPADYCVLLVDGEVFYGSLDDQGNLTMQYHCIHHPYDAEMGPIRDKWKLFVGIFAIGTGLFCIFVLGWVVAVLLFGVMCMAAYLYISVLPITVLRMQWDWKRLPPDSVVKVVRFSHAGNGFMPFPEEYRKVLLSRVDPPTHRFLVKRSRTTVREIRLRPQPVLGRWLR